MTILDIIEKKKNNETLSQKEIEYFVNGYTNNKIPDYQMSSLLMAIVINGMNLEETTNLTKAMINSGKTIDLSSVKGIKVDKHSTGGVGDKVSLVLGPIVASCGVIFTKMSGRGLGHTGGTIDKLESIPGFNCFYNEKDFKNLIKKSNMAIIGQTDDIVPADKKIYLLRDVSGTVNSMPLISSSIMSKKLATGADAILLDVKCGSGAFMKNEKETFDAVVSARAKATQMSVDIDDLTPEKLAAYQRAQGEIGSALGRLLAVTENYPELKANENFQTLQAQLEGTENRISVERRKFNETARKFNTTIRRFPKNIFASMFGFEKRPYFEAEEGSEKAPEVKF